MTPINLCRGDGMLHHEAFVPTMDILKVASRCLLKRHKEKFNSDDDVFTFFFARVMAADSCLVFFLSPVIYTLEQRSTKRRIMKVFCFILCSFLNNILMKQLFFVWLVHLV